MTQFAAPLICPTRTVEQAWIDYNGHMNMAYYSLLFDQALDHVFDLLGIGAAYVRDQQGSCFTMEAHITYLQEVKLGDRLRIEFQLLDWDSKRLHYFERMYHAGDGYLAATSEQICMHVDMRSRLELFLGLRAVRGMKIGSHMLGPIVIGEGDSAGTGSAQGFQFFAAFGDDMILVLRRVLVFVGHSQSWFDWMFHFADLFLLFDRKIRAYGG